MMGCKYRTDKDLHCPLQAHNELYTWCGNDINRMVACKSFRSDGIIEDSNLLDNRNEELLKVHEETEHWREKFYDKVFNKNIMLSISNIKGTDKQDKINRQVLDVLAILASNATNYSEQLSTEIDYLAKLVIGKDK